MYKKFFKRFLDIIISLLGLIILSPVILIVAILVRIKLGTPIFFKQERPGLNEKIFTLYKFRTMNDKKDENGNLLPDEERMTKFGDFLRSTSLDELPELINILKGEMSIVGPRPLLVDYLELYDEKQKHRHDVRPGLTGLAQINGRNNTTWEKRFEDDLKYIKNITFIEDFRIFLMTFAKVFKREGITQEGNATMERFEGGKKMNNVLFCSAGRRVKLIEDFRKTMGDTGKLVAANASNLAPAIYVADKYYIVPKITEENYIDTILDICKKEDIKIVCTLIDPEIKVLADNRKKFEELGILLMVPSSKTAELCFDKFKMFKYLKENGIETVCTYGSVEEFENNKDGVTFPVFVKPRTGSGSVGARRVDDIETLKNLFEKDETLIIQELMVGSDLDADVYVDTITNEVINVFLKNKLETKIGGANKTISFKDDTLVEFIKRIVSKFEFKGTINMDFFKRDGKYYLSEVNPRFGGGYIHPYAAGVDFIKYLIENANGNKNTPEIGNYEEGSVMMMYDDIVFIKPDEFNK